MSNKSQESYRAILKATSLFGSIQGFNIILSLIKTKVIALVLGASGIGVIGLFTSTLAVMSELGKLGLDTSAIKELSFALKKNDKDEVSSIVSALNKIILIFGSIIALLMIVFSTYLSRFTFGDDTFKYSFVFLTLVVFFNLLTAVKLSVLQGLRELKALAKVNVITSFLSLPIVLPLYYYLEFKGIVLALILSAFVAYLVSWYYVNKLALKKVKHRTKNIFGKYKSMIKLGVMFSLSGVLALLSAYLIRVGLGYLSTIEIVGFYTAGMVILDSYFGLVFKAIQTDYYPRISAISDNIKSLSNVVSQQGIIGLLLITPILILFMAFMPLVLEVLYTKKFIVLTEFMNWALLGLFFKTASWTIGYIILAKSDSNLFIKTAIVFNSLFLILTLLGFKYFGLEGIGIAYVVYFIVHLCVLFVITRIRYGLRLSSQFGYVFLTGLLFCIIGFYCTLDKGNFLKQIAIIILFVVSIFFSIYKINKIADLSVFFNSIFKASK